jgi:hypothetical protein
MLSNEPENVPIRPFPPKLPILALDSLPLYPYTDALLKKAGVVGCRRSGENEVDGRWPCGIRGTCSPWPVPPP